jgi:hypothetical protein
MKLALLSKPLELSSKANNEDIEIHIFTQFFIHKKETRNDELRYCLKTNQLNPFVYKIHLLNERMYSLTEMGLESNDKIVQTNFGKRLSFQAVFQYIREQKIRGYCVLLNGDIFLDDSIKYILTSTIHTKKQFLTLLRYEYNAKASLDKCPIFGPRFDSQDTWIFHTNQGLKEQHEKAFAFEFGRPGCDNKIVYLLSILGYEIFNDPRLIKTYHFHRGIMRDYTAKDALTQPWGVITPAGSNVLSLPPSLGINMADVCKISHGFKDIMFHDHEILYDYIKDKLASNSPFIIPRIAGIENNFAVFAHIKRATNTNEVDGYFQQVAPAMKTNAGIYLPNINSIMRYSELYLKAFENCELMGAWEAQGTYIQHIAQSYEFMRNSFQNKRMFWVFALDIFHYIYDSKAWTKSLKDKRILIISPFIDSIREKVPIRDKLYDGVDLFPGCSFIYAKPPMTQAGEPSRDFETELNEFTKRLDYIKNDYDVALVSCGGYGNLVCNYIFEKHKKSAIYVGGVLQMYFGVLGSRWLKERPDVVRLYLNPHWSKPKASERPLNCDQVEGGCYW